MREVIEFLESCSKEQFQGQVTIRFKNGKVLCATKLQHFSVGSDATDDRLKFFKPPLMNRDLNFDVEDF